MKALSSFLIVACIAVGFVSYAQETKRPVDPLVARVSMLESRVKALETKLHCTARTAAKPSRGLFAHPLTKSEKTLLSTHFNEDDFQSNWTETEYADGSSCIMQRCIDGISVHYYDKDGNVTGSAKINAGDYRP